MPYRESYRSITKLLDINDIEINYKQFLYHVIARGEGFKPKSLQLVLDEGNTITVVCGCGNAIVIPSYIVEKIANQAMQLMAERGE